MKPSQTGQIFPLSADFRKLFDTISSGVAVYEPVADGEDFVFVDLNRAGEKLSHVTREDVVGRRVTEVFPGVLPMGLLGVLHRVHRTGRTERLPLRVYEDDRIREWVENTVFRTSDGRVVAVYEDTTQKQQMQQALSDSELLHRTLVDTIPDIVWLKDPEGSYLRCNASFEQLVGKKEREILGKTDYDLFDPDSSASYREHDLKAIEANEPRLNREWLGFEETDREGLFETIKTPMRDQDGKLVGVLGISREITDYWKANKQLRETTALLEAAMDCSPAGIAIADVPSGRLRYVNSAGLWIRGEDREKVVEGVGVDQYVETWRILDFDGSPLPVEEVPLARAVLYGETCNRQFLIRRSGNEDRVVWAHAAPVKDEEGKVVAAIVVFPDITDLKKAEEENLHLQVQLQQAQKMESIGRLAGGVAHDFNNMLAVILGNVSLARGELKSGDPFEETQDAVEDSLREIKTAGQRAADLTQQLLAFSRKQMIQPETLDLNELIEGLRDFLTRTIGEDIELVFMKEPQLGRVNVDPVQMEQVLVNLIINARDSMPKGGRIVVRTANVDSGSSDLEEQPGSHVVVSIRDHGEGIEEEILEKIFDPFFTTKKDGKGHGLGLATVYGIVRQHGGDIRVSSEPGAGSTFAVYLPRHFGGGEKREPSADVVRAASGLRGEETVLVVEDEASVRKVMVRVLENHGYRVLSAGSGAEALELWEREDAEIDLLMTDVVMPDMNGVVLAEKMVEKKPGLKVLYTSGYTEEHIARHGVLRPEVHFLRKPAGSRETLGKVREALDS